MKANMLRFIGFVMVFAFFIFGGNVYAVKLEGKTNTLLIDSLPAITYTKGNILCKDTMFDKGILSTWFYDINSDGYYSSNEDIFSDNIKSYYEFGNKLFLAYSSRMSSGIKYLDPRCTRSQLIDSTEEHAQYITYIANSLNITTTYTLRMLDNGHEYLSKRYRIEALNPIYIEYLGDEITFVYPGSKKNLMYLRHNTHVINNRTYNFISRVWKCNGHKETFPLTSSYSLLSIGNGVFLFSALCYSSLPQRTLEVMVDDIDCSNKRYRYRQSIIFANSYALSEGEVIEAKLIYGIVKAGEEEIIEKVLEEEGCFFYNNGKREDRDVYLDASLPLYDVYTLEGITFANAFNLTYLDKLPSRAFYYISEKKKYVSGVQLSRDDLIRIARYYNKTIYSSCKDDEIYAASLAYITKNIYISDIKDADIYLCGNAKEMYLQHLKNRLFGIVLVPKTLEWRNIAVVYSYKYMPVVISTKEEDAIKEKIKESVRLLVNYVRSNPYFRIKGLHILILGGEEHIPFMEQENIKSDILLGNINDDEFIDFAVGRVVYPYNPKDYYYIDRAVLMSDYEQHSYLAFLNRYNGMFSSLLAKAWFERYGVDVNRYVERRFYIEEGKERLMGDLGIIKEVVMAIAHGASLPLSAIVGVMVAAYDASSTTAEAIHELRTFEWNEILSSILNGDYDVFEQNLTSTSFESLNNADFFGYFGVVKEGVFDYPGVDVDSLSYDGMFYLDYDNTYDEALILHEKGGFGYALLNGKSSRDAQERLTHILRMSLYDTSTIGNALKDSANIMIAKKSILESLGIKSTLEEAYGRVLIGDPSTILLLPRMKKEKLAKLNVLNPSMKERTVLRKSILSLNSNKQTHSLPLFIRREYVFPHMQNISFMHNNSILFVDAIKIPTYQYEVSISIDKVEVNTTREYLNRCVNGHYENRAYGKSYIYVYAMLLCVENNKTYFVRSLNVSVYYLPQVEIINATDRGKYIALQIFSSEDVNSTLYFITTRGYEAYNLSIKKGVNTYILDKELMGIEPGNYTLLLENSTYYLNVVGYESIHITEIYPNPPREELEFIEIYYNGKSKEAVILINETSIHNIHLNMSSGFYVLVKNLSAFKEEFEFDERRVIEIPNLRLNNKGESVELYVDGVLTDNVSYTSNRCINEELCSVNIINDTLIYTTPNPFSFPEVGMKNDSENIKDESNINVEVLTYKAYKGGEIKVRVKKDKCSKDAVNVSIAIGNYTTFYNGLLFLCSKTLTYNLPHNITGKQTIKVKVVYNNETITYKDDITIYDKYTLKCSLYAYMDLNKYVVDIGDPISLQLIIKDNTCEYITHPIEVEYGIKDEKGNVVKKYTTLYDFECDKKTKKTFRLSKSDIGKINSRVLYAYAIINPMCSANKAIMVEREIAYVGQLGESERVKKTYSSYASHRPSLQPTYKGISSSSAFSTQNKKESPIRINNVVVIDDKVYVYVENKNNRTLYIYSYVVYNSTLASYNCFNNTRGWKSNLMKTSSNAFSLGVCLKDNIVGRAKLVVKYSLDGKDFERTEIEIYIPQTLSEEGKKKREENMIKKNSSEIKAHNVVYKCIESKGKPVLYVYAPQEINITIIEGNASKEMLIKGEHVFNARNNVFIIGNTTIRCEKYFMNSRVERGILKTLLSFIIDLFENLL